MTEFVERGLYRFSTFIFKNGNTPKPKFMIVLKRLDDGVLIAPLPTSKDRIPADLPQDRSVYEFPERGLHAYKIKQGLMITDQMFSFPLDTFIYGENVDKYNEAEFHNWEEKDSIEIEFLGRLKEELFNELYNSIKTSSVTKRSIKKCL